MKRGLEKSTLIGLILLLVGATIMFPIISQVAVFMNGYVEGGTCQASVALASFKAEKACIDVLLSPIPLNCPKRHIEVSDSIEVTQKGEKETVPEELDASAVETMLLEELRSCWEQFGEGEKKLFPGASPNIVERLQNKGSNSFTACHICSEIVFEKDYQISLQKRLDEPMLDSEESYREYFNNPNARCEDEFGVDCWDEMEKLITEEDDLMPERVEEQRGFSPTGDRSPNVDKTEQVREERGLNYGVTQMDDIDPEKTYAVVMVRKRFDYCESGVEVEDTNFAYIVAHDELVDAGEGGLCDAVIS